jgi:hypothetical protein
MILKPDLDAVYVDPFSATPMLILVCDIVEPSTGELYARDPRSTAKRAEAFVKTTGVGDTVYVGPEAEFFVFDDVRSTTATTATASRSTTSSCPPTRPRTMKAATWPTVRAPRAAISPWPRSTAWSTSAAKWSRPCSTWACPATSTTTKWPRRSTSWA